MLAKGKSKRGGQTSNFFYRALLGNSLSVRFNVRIQQTHCVASLVAFALWSFFGCYHAFAQRTQKAGEDSQVIVPQVGMGQLGAASHWSHDVSHLSDFSGRDQSTFLLQKTVDSRLFFTPDHSFFPKLGLRAAGVSDIPDRLQLNGGKSFRWIDGWNLGESAQWSWWCQQPGFAKFRVFMKAGETPGRFEVRFGQHRFPFTTSPSSGGKQEVIRGDFRVTEVGRHEIEITCLDEQSSSQLLWIELSGDAVRGASVVRKRWRPSAAHTRFSSSKSKRPIQMWVMEMDAVPGDLGFYSPVTTPFGYYGPTWLPDGRVNSSFNFSLWSYGRGKDEPPVEQLSHLLGIGDSQATFGHFGHEGTGVKIREWEPLKGSQSQSQVFALRVEAGEQYNTYYSYFYQAKEKCWKLFGIGNQFNKGKPIKDLWVGSFVEVPGPPHVQRSGVYPRRMRYRGWVMDDSGEWFCLDQMTNGNIDRESGLTHTRRGVTEEGWFYLETGGWGYQLPEQNAMVRLPSTLHVEKPDYLNDDSVGILQKFPTQVKFLHGHRDANDLLLQIEAKALGGEVKVDLFFGKEEGLTFVDRWDKVSRLQLGSDPLSSIRVKRFFLRDDAAQPTYMRLRLMSERGQFWSPRTWVWETGNQRLRPR